MCDKVYGVTASRFGHVMLHSQTEDQDDGTHSLLSTSPTSLASMREPSALLSQETAGCGPALQLDALGLNVRFLCITLLFSP